MHRRKATEALDERGLPRVTTATGVTKDSNAIQLVGLSPMTFAAGDALAVVGERSSPSEICLWKPGPPCPGRPSPCAAPTAGSFGAFSLAWA